MACVEFNVDGYRCFDKRGCLLFSANKTHDALFDYVAKDITDLPKLLAQYVSERIDTVTFAIKHGQHRDDSIDEIQRILMSAHPYFKHEPKRPIINAIGKYFNELLLHLCYGKRTLDPDFPKEWYLERIELLLSPLLSMGDNYPMAFYQAYQEQVGSETYTGGYSASEIEQFIPNVPQRMPEGFSHEIRTQRTVFNMLCLILDISMPELKQLSIPQRTWLYENIFGMTVPSAPKRLSFFPQTAYIHKSEDTFRSLSDLRYSDIGRDGIPANMMEALDTAIELAKAESSIQLGEEYEIDSLQQLLLLEVMFMIQAGTVIRKCRNCGKYFMVTDRKAAYCKRKDESGQSCSDVGSRRSFQRKMNEEEALKIYTRAYKTHYARLSKKKMRQTDFEKWCAEAKAKLTQVRAGELDLPTFQAWLKK